MSEKTDYKKEYLELLMSANRLLEFTEHHQYCESINSCDCSLDDLRRDIKSKVLSACKGVNNEQ